MILLITLKNQNPKKMMRKNKEFEMSLDDINHYLELTYDQNHLDGIIQSIPLAWDGAIKNAYGANSELSLDALSKELEYSGAGTLKSNLRI